MSAALQKEKEERRADEQIDAVACSILYFKLIYHPISLRRRYECNARAEYFFRDGRCFAPC